MFFFRKNVAARKPPNQRHCVAEGYLLARSESDSDAGLVIAAEQRGPGSVQFFVRARHWQDRKGGFRTMFARFKTQSMVRRAGRVSPGLRVCRILTPVIALLLAGGVWPYRFGCITATALRTIPLTNPSMLNTPRGPNELCRHHTSRAKRSTRRSIRSMIALSKVVRPLQVSEGSNLVVKMIGPMR